MVDLLVIQVDEVKCRLFQTLGLSDSLNIREGVGLDPKQREIRLEDVGEDEVLMRRNVKRRHPDVLVLTFIYCWVSNVPCDVITIINKRSQK